MIRDLITEIFIVGDYDFGIDRDKSIIDIEKDHVHELRIVGSQVNLDKLISSKEFLFNWIVNPPEFYANEIRLDRKNKIIINQSNGYEHDSALYIGDHFDLHINLSIHEEWILVAGFSIIDKKEYPLVIRVRKD